MTSAAPRRTEEKVSSPRFASPHRTYLYPTAPRSTQLAGPAAKQAHLVVPAATRSLHGTRHCGCLVSSSTSMVSCEPAGAAPRASACASTILIYVYVVFERMCYVYDVNLCRVIVPSRRKPESRTDTLELRDLVRGPILMPGRGSNSYGYAGAYPHVLRLKQSVHYFWLARL